ncbi:hypothetical protein [Roseibium sp.]|uniref:hypothetical protein n=1 Tax=Roseibium sp. TaxID=1936156 RepID=UPI003B507011
MQVFRLAAAAFLAGYISSPAVAMAQDAFCYLPEKPFDYQLSKSDPLYEAAREEFQTYLEELEAYMLCLEQERSQAFSDLKEGYEEFQRIYGADAVFRAPVPTYSTPQ